MAWPTASSLERVIACPASAVFPQVIDDSKRPDRDRGTVIHVFVKRVAMGMDAVIALSLVPKDWQQVCRRINFDRVAGDIRQDRRCEVSYGITPGEESVRELGVDLDRNYPALGENEIAGTNDIEGTRFDGVPVTADVKTGNDVTAAEENPQVQHAARARQLMTGAPEVEGRIIYIRPTGYVEIDRHIFDRLELESFEDRAVEMGEGVARARSVLAAGVTPTVRTGSWCKYCPAMPACPAYAGLARRFVPELEAVHSQLATLTPEQQGQAWVKLKTIKRLADAVEDALKAIAEQMPIPLGDGTEIRPSTRKQKHFNKGRAIELLTTHGATAEEIESCDVMGETTQFRPLKIRRSA